ncbi:hypothetical protein FRC17_008369 [Serendipita sp. 399]|nr:hypothetical protein FRC17_008369 [Serendipita sp. 399]
MPAMEALLEDRSNGKARRHPNLYLKDGTLVIQVEDVLFNVHRSVLARYSTTIRDMLEITRESGINTRGNKENPLILTGDTVAAWELLLGLQYNTCVCLLALVRRKSSDSALRSLRVTSEQLKGEHLLMILGIANKYCMERIEQDIVKELKKASDYDGFVNIVVASRIVGSDKLYQDGLQCLLVSGSSPNMEQANRMGSEVTLTVMQKLLGEAAHFVGNLKPAMYLSLTVINRVPVGSIPSS